MAIRNRQLILWVTDGWDELDHLRDTSLRLVRECLMLGVAAFWADYRTIHWDNGESFVDVSQVALNGSKLSGDPFVLYGATRCRPADFRAIIYRVDPPVDDAYRHSLQILSAAAREARGKTTIVNAPGILLGSTSKLEILSMKGFIPPTLVSSQRELLQTFGESHGATVLKPLHQCNSVGISVLGWSAPQEMRRSERALRHLTREFTVPVLLQRRLVKKLRELRCWYVSGSLIGFAKKSEDPLSNPTSATSFRPCAMTPREIAVSNAVRRHLRQRKIFLAAADILNGYLIDLNFASPGLIVEMEEALNANLSRRIVKGILNLN
jgi:glutathione synthase